jgi:N-acetyl-anhydromuramyl-L-alanine amidase AmpD
VFDVDPIGFNVFYIVPEKTHFFNTSVFWDIAAKRKLGRLSLFPWRNILPSLSQTTFLHTTSRRQYKTKHSSYKYILTVFSAFLLKMGAF